MKMKRGMMILSAAALTLAMAGPALAQEPSHGAVANADYSFFDTHRDLARQLSRNPALIDDRHFVDSHPALHEYLRTHPEVRREFKEHPYQFMHSEDWYMAHHN